MQLFSSNKFIRKTFRKYNYLENGVRNINPTLVVLFFAGEGRGGRSKLAQSLKIIENFDIRQWLKVMLKKFEKLHFKNCEIKVTA